MYKAFLGLSDDMVQYDYDVKKRLRCYILAASRLFQSDYPVIEEVLYLKGRSII